MDNQEQKLKEQNEKNVFGKVSSELKNKRTLAALSYLWIFCLIPLLKSKDEFVQFHAKQGLIIFFIELILSLVGWIPLVGWLASVVVTIVALIGLIKALNGEKWKIPYIYEWSQKIKI